MCTGILHLDPSGAWPIRLAFVRDEDRERSTQPPGRWWPEAPSRIGGRDAREGGTWLAVDDGGEGGRLPRLAFVQNRRNRALDAPPIPHRISRGTLPGRVLDEGGLVLADGEIERLDPFVLVLADVEAGSRWWNWNGERLETGEVAPGWHMVTSAGLDRPDLSERHRRWMPRFAEAPLPDPRPGDDTRAAWGAWVDLLDGRGAQRGDASSLVIVGIDEHPTFGTVGASLVAIGPAGVRYDVNRSHAVDPGRWERVDVDAMDAAASG